MNPDQINTNEKNSNTKRKKIESDREKNKSNRENFESDREISDSERKKTESDREISESKRKKTESDREKQNMDNMINNCTYINNNADKMHNTCNNKIETEINNNVTIPKSENTLIDSSDYNSLSHNKNMLKQYSLDNIRTMCKRSFQKQEDYAYNTFTKAIIHGNFDYYEIFKIMCEMKIDLNCRSSYNTYLIHGAARFQSKETIELLLANNININIRDSNNKSVLHIVCKYRNTDIIDLFTSKKLDIHEEDDTLMRPIHYACLNTSYNVVEHLINYKVDLNCVNNLNISPLHLACKFQPLSTIKKLVENGSNITNIYDNDFQSLCHYAVRSDFFNQDMFNFFIERKIKIDDTDKNGNRPIHILCKYNKSYDNLKLFLDCGINTTPSKSINTNIYIWNEEAHKYQNIFAKDQIKCFIMIVKYYNKNILKFKFPKVICYEIIRRLVFIQSK